MGTVRAGSIRPSRGRFPTVSRYRHSLAYSPGWVEKRGKNLKNEFCVEWLRISRMTSGSSLSSSAALELSVLYLLMEFLPEGSLATQNSLFTMEYSCSIEDWLNKVFWSLIPSNSFPPFSRSSLHYGSRPSLSEGRTSLCWYSLSLLLLF